VNPPAPPPEDETPSLLSPADPTPFTVQRPEGGSPFLIVCDHAGRTIPERLGDLGLPQEVRDRHIGWDIGAVEVAEALGARLDACTVSQAYSRLVIDCNRPPQHLQSVVETSDGVTVPGNAGLSRPEVEARLREIHAPYHRHIAELLQRRLAAGKDTLLVSVHSFTPVMNDTPRPWTFGVLHDGASPLSSAMLDLLGRQPGAVVGDNQPYSLEPSVDFTVPHHAIANGLDYLELEIRQDTIATAAGAQRVADLLARLLPKALQLSGRR
jgi:predicted N-formylglutamate amidohydrolase